MPTLHGNFLTPSSSTPKVEAQHVRLKSRLCHIPSYSNLGLDWCRKRVSATDTTNTAMNLKLILSQLVSILSIFCTKKERKKEKKKEEKHDLFTSPAAEMTL
jgi:hypothetical protein